MTAEKLVSCLRGLPVSDPARAQLFLNDMVDAHTGLASLVEAHPEVINLVQAVALDSSYLRELMVGHEGRFFDLLSHPVETSMDRILSTVRSLDVEEIDQVTLSEQLRLLKQEAALLTGLADLGGVWTVEEVTGALSDFADETLNIVLRFALKKEACRGKISLNSEVEPERSSGIIVLAMGKHGARELNYSSDIDLIILYETSQIACDDPHDIQPAMVRIVQMVVKLMQERTEHGYVFRTDLRLRPDPGSTAVALSTDAALQYYEGLGQNWERAAFIKARPAAGDISAANGFLSELSPFVWRKYMDFVTIQDVHAMKRQTHVHKGHGRIALHGHNVKLGRGGIREIEFFVQTQQLIAGGRNARLRERGTVVMLDKLADEGWITVETATELSEEYRFLRKVEHCIQMRRDEQTHDLPKDEETFSAIGRLAGFAESATFQQRLLSCFENVSSHYAKLFEDEESLSVQEGPLIFTGDEDDPETLHTLTQIGFERASQVVGIIRGWHKGRYRATRTARAREVLTHLKPRLLQAFGNTAEPDRALFAFDAFLKSLPAGVQLFSLLNANRHLLDLIAQLMGSAPRLADTIAQHPHIFDALLEPQFFGSLPSTEALQEQIETSLTQADDYQDVLDRARNFTQEQQFLIGTRLLSGTVSTLETQALYSKLADVVILALLKAVQSELKHQHGEIEGADVAILAMGKLGGSEMTPSSDLDLILIYDVDDANRQSDGRRPLPAGQFYTRLTQRFVSALSAPTGAGVAYEVDLRLRPSGKAGPLATDINAFEAYQNENAWTWEHMALTRARTIGGSDALQTKIRRIIRSVLAKPRDLKALRKDIVDMRMRIHEAKPADSLWDIKLAPGGLTDIEFIAQYLQLSAAADDDGILFTHTGSALAAIEASKLVGEPDIVILCESYDFYSALLQIFRLCFDGDFDPDNAPDELVIRLCARADVPDLARLEIKLKNSQEAVREIFNRILGEPEEALASDPVFVSGATQH